MKWKIKTNFTKYVNKLKEAEMSDSDFLKTIRASTEFRDLKTIKPLPKNWVKRVLKKLPAAIFDAIKEIF